MNENAKVKRIVSALGLVPLEEEGGLYRCVYEGGDNGKGQHISSAIYYLLTKNTFSHMHKLESDEIYHYYMGDGIEILLLYPDGTAECKKLGSNLEEGERPQIVVPGGVWQGAKVSSGGEYCLVGTTMAPAYRPEEYRHGDCEALCTAYPQAAEMIAERCGRR